MENLNTPQELDRLKTTVLRQLQTLQGAPGVQMIEVRAWAMFYRGPAMDSLLVYPSFYICYSNYLYIITWCRMTSSAPVPCGLASPLSARTPPPPPSHFICSLTSHPPSLLSGPFPYSSSPPQLSPYPPLTLTASR